MHWFINQDCVILAGQIIGNKIDILEIDSHKNTQEIFDKFAKLIQRRKDSCSANGAGTIKYPETKKINK